MAEVKTKKETVKKATAKVEVEKKKDPPRPKIKASDLPTLDDVRWEIAKKSDEHFCKYYIKIVNKLGEDVQFIYNPIQKQIDDKINELESQGKPARIIVLKARQEGVSTYAQSKIIARIIKNKNRNALVVAHRDDSTSAIFEKSKFMYKYLPDNIKPLQQASNARELIFDKPPHYKGKQAGLNSKIKVQTAGKEGIGRSDTHYYVHLSEFAFYEGTSPKKQLSGILQSVPKVPGTIVIIESTANGMNEFKELWDAAEAGENDFVPMFFSWHDYPEYQMPVKDEEERKEIMGNLSDYEKKIVKLFELPAERIKWYRWTLKNDCNNDHDMMRQENPSYPKEAFLSTGRPVFDNQNIEIRIEELKKLYKEHPPKVGRFSFEWVQPDIQDQIKPGSVLWVDDPNGFVTIYEDKENDNTPYVIGGDTKGEGKDYYTATVINNITGKRVATIRMQSSNSKPYSHQIYCLGKHFNDALIGIEMNHNTGPLEELERLRYPKQYMRQSYDNIKKEIQKKFGWKTDGNTRPLIIDKEIDLIENNIELFPDLTMLGECLTFIYDKNNRPDAQSGKHDDLLFSDMIANEIRPQQRFTFHEERKTDYSKLSADILEDLENASAEMREYILKKVGAI